MRDRLFEVGEAFPEIFSSQALCLSNSYHTALFFTFLSLPAILFRLNPYYAQKGHEIWRENLTPEVFESLPEIRRAQEERLKELLEKRRAFMERFSALLDEAEKGRSRKKPFSEVYTYEEVPDFGKKRVEIDEMARALRESLFWHMENRRELIEYIKKLEDQNSRLMQRVSALEEELKGLIEYKEKLEYQNLRLYAEKFSA